jgi:protein-tyrosine phosphatase
MLPRELRCRVKAPLAYLSLAAAFTLLAWKIGGVGWLLLWPAGGFGYVAALYLLRRPGGWGKQADGTSGWAGRLLLWPVRVTLGGLWHLARRKGPAMQEIAPNIWLGRRPLASELPEAVGLLLDLTSEFTPARGVVTTNRRLVTVPTLDYSPPDLAAASVALAELEHQLDAAGDRPAVLIHCAAGFGRSATVAAALLVRRGLAGDVEAAIELMRQARPGVKLTPTQRRRAVELARSPTNRTSAA